ncbi:MAG TPA: hypothetical protein VI300_20260, partial [Solirubrobacter sp.]
CGATTLAILGSCDITIELRPAAAGPAAGTLTVPSDDPDGPATAALAGVAQAVPQPVVRPVLQPLPDRVPPQLKATVVHRKLKDALRKGLAVTVRCSEACSLDATLALPPGQRKALRLRQTQVGHVTAKLGQAGSTTVTFKLSSALRKAAKRVKQLKLLLTVAATDLAGNRATTTPRITLRR